MPTALRDRLLITAALALWGLPAAGQSLPPPEHRQLARAILEELVEINTVRDSGATRAATALAKRLAGGGFPSEDVHLVGPKPHKQNLVFRLRGRGKGKLASDLRAVSGQTPDAKAVERLAGVPLYNSSMRNTCVATMLKAGHAENALPQRAQATIQCRLLPGESPEDTRTTLARVLSDTLIRVTLPDEPEISPASPLSPEVMTAVERVTTAMWPGVVVLPVMDPWSSDGARLRKAGVPVYGSPESSSTSVTCAPMARTSGLESRPSMRASSSCTG